jgi:hypothetical protein
VNYPNDVEGESVMEIDLTVLAGGVSTVIFAGSVMPMIVKAVRTRDLASYSLGNLLLSNMGNLVHSVYIYSLPAGPIWALHAFYLVTTGFMLVMYIRHEALGSKHLHGSAAARHAGQDPPKAGLLSKFEQSTQLGSSNP